MAPVFNFYFGIRTADIFILGWLLRIRRRYATTGMDVSCVGNGVYGIFCNSMVSLS